jgi:hypothetical protein
MKRYETIDEAIRTIGGELFRTDPKKALAGMRIDPAPDGRTVVLRLDGRTVKARIAPGVQWHEAVLASRYFERKPPQPHPLSRIEPWGTA